MKSTLRSVVATGILAGALFFLSAFIPKAYATALVWPLLAGARVARRCRHDGSRDSSNDVRRLISAASSGAVAALVFVVCGVSVEYVLGGGRSIDLIQSLGLRVSSVVPRSAIVNLFILAFVTLPLAALIGGMVVVIAARQHFVTRAPSH